MHESVYRRGRKYFKTKSGMDTLYAFNFYNAYASLSRSRAKPWDDPELDSIEGKKVLSFVLTTVSQVVFSLPASFVINLLGAFGVLNGAAPINIMAPNVAMEVFFFFSAFITTYRCF